MGKRTHLISYQTYPAPDALSAYIRFFWSLESDEPYTHYGMADYCPELVFHVKGQFEEILPEGRKEKSFLSGVQGQSAQTKQFQINQGFGIFGVYLSPLAIPLLFNFPALELTNQSPDLTSLLGQEGRDLEEKVFEAPAHDQRIRIIVDFFRSKLPAATNSLPVYQAMQSVLHQKGLVRIDQLAVAACLSERQFERQFRIHTGFSPKLFSRIVRFHAAMNEFGRPGISLTDIAYEYGYYDQSHFIHEFRQFSGFNPKQFFSGNSGATDWRE